jgi:hypothetical protein
MHSVDLDYYRKLKCLAASDLSLAHLDQHATGARMAVHAAGLDISGIGSYSVVKPNDSLIFVNGQVTGQKCWVSNAPYSDYAVMIAKENDLPILVLVEDLSNSQIDMIPTVGLEGTHTAHVTFSNSTATKLFNLPDLKLWPTKCMVDAGFITNYVGVSQALFQDIDQYTTDRNIQCSYNKNKIKLNLSVQEILWNSYLSRINEPESKDFWNFHNTVYAFVKKTLVEVTQFVVELTGSGLYEIGTPEHQRYTDALIYCSHMKNLYYCIKEN